MTSSGTYQSTLTAEAIVQAACEELGYLAAGEVATGADLELGMRQLNFMLKSFSARGVNLWREEETSVTVPAGSASIALDPRIENVMQARVRVSANYERDVFRYERSQYFSLPNKAMPGSPTSYYVDRQRDAAVLYVWPVPAVDTVLLLDVSYAIQDVTAPDQTLDVPAKWMEALYCSLAARLSAPFGITRIDPNTVARIEARAAAFEQLLLNEDRPASVFMGPYNERDF